MRHKRNDGAEKKKGEGGNAGAIWDAYRKGDEQQGVCVAWRGGCCCAHTNA